MANFRIVPVLTMDDISSYQFQLTQVSESLARDPLNADLIALQRDLEELISLCGGMPAVSSASESKGEAGVEGVSANPSSKTRSEAEQLFKPGDSVLAQWAGDSVLYAATVLQNLDDGIHARIAFDGYGDESQVRIADLKIPPKKELVPSVKIPASALALMNESGGAARAKRPIFAPNTSSSMPLSSSSSLAPTTSSASTKPDATPDDRHPKRTKTKDVATAQKQKAWLDFAHGKKGTKKLKTTAPMRKQSIFATPDDPNAKVGVTGSGRPMTQYSQKKKWVFDGSDAGPS